MQHSPRTRRGTSVIIGSAMTHTPFLDLHLHLDGSLSIANVRALAAMQNIAVDETDAALSARLGVEPGCRDLNGYLEKFAFPLALLQTPDALEASVRTLLSELAATGAVYVEIRFAPQLHLRGGMTQTDAVEAAIGGLAGAAIPANLILCCMRGADNFAENAETVRAAARFLGRGVCALDLAGAEGLFPTEDFAGVFAAAREACVPFTVHAGEAAGPESVRTALSFGAARIGHGVRAIEDPALVDELARRGVTLELCPTSNLDTRVFESIDEFPIMKFIEAGVNVTVNTDDMAVSRTTIAREFERLSAAFGVDPALRHRLQENAVRAAFCGDGLKKELLEKLRGAAPSV